MSERNEFVEPKDPENKFVQLDRDEIIEQLYNLDGKDLRRVAWEALLMSDGPDSVFVDPDSMMKDSAILVKTDRILMSKSAETKTQFTIWSAEDHE
jgi:hypothetical protein